MRGRTFRRCVEFGGVFLCLALGACEGANDETGGAGSTGSGSTSSGGSSAGSGSSSGSGSAPGSGGTANGSGSAAGSGATGNGSGSSAGSGAAPGSGSSAGSGSAPGSGGATACSGPAPTLAVTRLATTSIADLGRPFSGGDRDGPTSWAAQYGQAPEITPFASEDGLAVLLQDQSSGDAAHVVHVSASETGYAVDAAYEVASLGRIMGLTRDTAGNYYVATGVDEDDDVDAVYPPNDIHRPDVVRIVKFDVNGCVLMESDVDIERGKKSSDSEILVNPMVAASSRLVWGADRLLLVHGHNTEPDAGIGGTRHQKAISTHIDAQSGAATRTDTMWVSHSFDQRAFYDGTGFVEVHLGDAYPRAIAFGRYTDSGGAGGYQIYRIKGDTGANNTYTRLGGVVPLTDATYGYLVLFATERSTAASSDMVGGTRDLAVVRVQKAFHQSNSNAWVVDDGPGTTTHVVTSAGKSETNHVRWLTDLGAGTHAERPRIVATADNEFVVLWEQWTQSGNQSSFASVQALTIDGAGAVVTPARALSGASRIVRGDDAVALGGKAIYVTGDAAANALVLNVVSPDLSYERVVLP